MRAWPRPTPAAPCPTRRCAAGCCPGALKRSFLPRLARNPHCAGPCGPAADTGPHWAGQPGRREPGRRADRRRVRPAGVPARARTARPSPWYPRAGRIVALRHRISHYPGRGADPPRLARRPGPVRQVIAPSPGACAWAEIQVLARPMLPPGPTRPWQL